MFFILFCNAGHNAYFTLIGVETKFPKQLEILLVFIFFKIISTSLQVTCPSKRERTILM